MHRTLHAFIIHFRWEGWPFDFELIEQRTRGSQIILM